MKFQLIFALFMALILCANEDLFAMNQKIEKKTMISNVIQVINKLYTTAKDAKGISFEQADEVKSINLILDKIVSIEELKRIAIICDTISRPQNAEDIYFDVWFTQCFDICIYKISEFHSEEALKALIKIKDTCDLQGGDLLYIEEFISKIGRQGDVRMGTF
jgi:hypothetical protein